VRQRAAHPIAYDIESLFGTWAHSLGHRLLEVTVWDIDC